MNKTGFKLLLLLLCFTLQLLSANPQTTLLLNFAKKYYFRENYEQASAKVKSILETDPENPEANILDALLLMREKNAENIIIAREMIEKYGSLIKDDPFSNYALGRLHQIRQAPELAQKYFRKSLDQSEKYVPALIQLGEVFFQEMLKYYYRISDSDLQTSFREYAIDDFDDALYYLKQAIEIQPQNKRAIYVLCNLYFESDEFQEMEKLLRKALTYNSHNKDFNLFMGLCLNAQRRYPDAAVYFEAALEEMGAAEKNVFLNPAIFGRIADSVQNVEDANVFWSGRDPMYLSRQNERLIAHYGRVAYANLRFSIPEFGVEGWRTDRGQTHIRYGSPNYIYEYAKSMEFNVIYPPTQVWVYDGFHLMFSDEFWNGQYRFSEPSAGNSNFRERTNIDYGIVAKDVFTSIPEKFEYEMPGGRFTAPYQINFFRSDSLTECLLSYGLPVGADVVRSGYRYKSGFFVLNDRNRPMFEKRDQVESGPAESNTYLLDTTLVSGMKFDFISGSFPYSFEIIDEINEMNFRHTGNFAVPDFYGMQMMVSDIILAANIQPVQKENNFTRNGLEIIPNIRRIFKSDSKLYMYLEVYNLIPNSNGDVFYTVENTIQQISSGNFIKRLISGKSNKVSIVNEYSGRSRDDFVVISMDISNLNSGDYKIEIIIRDEIGFFELTKTAEIIVKNKLN